MRPDNVFATRSKARRAGLIGAIAGLAAAGVAAGVATERHLINKARNDPNDPYRDEPFGRLGADTTTTVTTPDGVDLHVETVTTRATGGPEAVEPEATVVFVHGYCLDMGTFHFQRRALADSDIPVRAVYYDQPGHGRSGPLPAPVYGLDELADALRAVIERTAPTGPVILAGHSMGAMTIMVFARRHPDLFTERVAGVSLLSTSGGGLDKVTFGAPRALTQARRLFLPLLSRAASLTPNAIDRIRRIAGDLAWVLTRRYGFATPKPSPALVSYVEHMNTATPIRTVIGFSLALLEHDEREKLASLGQVPTLICVGNEDQFTPAEHSTLLSELLPHASLVVIPHAGHVALLENPHAVSRPLLAALTDITTALAADRPDRRPDNRGRPRRWRRDRRTKREDGN